ncbi:hypothetical protein JHK87_038866 [Glycine soja]|nr:hypothetical protein JHK87_038866 [Glycine soja]
MGKLQSWPKPWPQRLNSKQPSLPTDSDAKDSKRWSEFVSDVYVNGLSMSSVQNVMDMNAGYARSLLHKSGFGLRLLQNVRQTRHCSNVDIKDLNMFGGSV